MFILSASRKPFTILDGGITFKSFSYLVYINLNFTTIKTWLSFG